MLKQLQADGLDLSAFWSEAEFATLFADAHAGLRSRGARSHLGLDPVQARLRLGV